MDSTAIDHVITALVGLENPDAAAIKSALTSVMITPDEDPQNTPVLNALDWIKTHFSKPNLPAIRASLAHENGQGDDNSMAEACLKAIDARAPLSMAVTHYLMTAPKYEGLSVAAALDWDNTMACRITLRPDFIEGVRALLIDKDNAPEWHPASIDDVTPEMLDDIFSETDMITLDYPQGYNPQNR